MPEGSQLPPGVTGEPSGHRRVLGARRRVVQDRLDFPRATRCVALGGLSGSRCSQGNRACSVTWPAGQETPHRTG